MVVTRGFRGKRRDGAGERERVPPGQYLTPDFPVLSAGPTPHVNLADWSLVLEDPKRRELFRCSWTELLALPATEIKVDIHCVTKWSKLDTTWKGVSFDTLLDAAGGEPPTQWLMAYCDGDYTTNVPVADLRGGKGLVAYEYDGKPLAPAHGGPARLLVPHLYFWKSAKWVRRLRFLNADTPGFWESHGYHLYGDPWKEQRYDGD
jgi:DMSO/TMAO reductase YedYZ molybdopterin-dependent catalytic subunit